MPRMAVQFDNVAEMLEQLGDIDPRRVRSWPPPGKATEKDLLDLLDHKNLVCELVDGILVEKVMGMKESALATQISRVIGNYVEEHDLGVVAGADGPFKLLNRLIRIPDVSFIAWDQLPAREYPTEPIPRLYPDLAVEVLSVANTDKEMERKLKEYFLSGTRLVWFVDPDRRTVRVYSAPDESTRLSENDILTGGDVLPGFTLRLRTLFAKVPRSTRKPTARRKRRG